MFSEQIDARLDPTEILKRLLNIFNENKDEGDNFTGNVNNQSEEITIYNNHKPCYVLNMPILIGEKYTITGGLNTQCSDSKGSGSKNIQNIILFGKLYNYDTFMLIDDSRLNFKIKRNSIYITLALIKLLTIGNTWYSQFGFENSFTINLKSVLPTFIHSSFNSLQTLYCSVIDANCENNENCSLLKSNFLKKMEDNLLYFKKIDINVNINNIISVFFSNILNNTYAVCPNKNCPEEYGDVIEKINIFIDFIIGNIIIILSIPKTNIEHYIMTKSEPTNFANLIYTLLVRIKNLSLNLKPSLQFIEYKKGGKLKKSKITKKNNKHTK
jgi:hypothetical protein